MTTRLGVTLLEDRTVPAVLLENFTESVLVGNLTLPTVMEVAPDGRIFVAEKFGTIRVIKNGSVLPTPFATLNVDANGERGLIGLVLDPNFQSNGYIYTYHTVPSSEGGPFNRISRFTADGDVAASGSRVTLLDLDPLGSVSIHNGGAMHFGPDGKLYVATGDAANPLNSQNLGNRHGKILRFNPDGTIPSDNPSSILGISGTTTGVNRAIWAAGLRNPFTFAFQPGTGAMFINDVGGDDFEEINFGQAGANYGWPITEGFQPPGVNGISYPIYSYSNAGGAAISGGVFYNPLVMSFPSQYAGDYFFGDFVKGKIFIRDGETGAITEFASQIAPGIVDLDILPDGSLIYLSFSDTLTGVNPSTGSIRVIRYVSGDQPPTVSVPPHDLLVSVGEPARFEVQVNGTAPLSFQWQRQVGHMFEDIPGANGPALILPTTSLADDGSKFRLIITNAFGVAISPAATLRVTSSLRPTVTIDQPDSATRFRAGDTISFKFSGFDPETGQLPPAAFIYRVDYITGSAPPRPFVNPQVGNSGFFTIPTITPFLRTDVAYRITVTVTDDVGLTATAVRDILPVTSTFRLESSIPGGTLLFDGKEVPSGTAVSGVVGVTRTLEAPETVVAGGILWKFLGWSDGGPRVRMISTPEQPTTFLARYEVVATPSGVLTRNMTTSVGADVRRTDFGVETLFLQPFGPDFLGEIRIAQADLNGDGVPEIIAAAGPGGGPHVRIFDGQTREELASFYAFDPAFTGGVYVAAGDVTGDGVAELILAAGPGAGPHVKVLRFRSGAFGDLSEVHSLFAFEESFRGGTRVAVGDLTGDGVGEILLATAAGGGPRIRVLNGKTLDELASFYAYEESYRGGIWISAGDLNGDGRAEIVVGTDFGGAPRVRAFDGSGAELWSFYAYDPSFTGGVRVAVNDITADGFGDIITGAGPGGGPHVKGFRGDTLAEIENFFAGPEEFRLGVFVG